MSKRTLEKAWRDYDAAVAGLSALSIAPWKLVDLRAKVSRLAAEIEALSREAA